ncbi:MAG: porin [Gammaproteobacteria bacterium]|nr:MAG: porin [Gammaproteobacteria bacterium]
MIQRVSQTILMVVLTTGFINGEAQATNFGSPDAVENTIESDAASVPSFLEERLLDPWFEWKQGLQEDTGFSFGLDYSSLYLKSNEDGFSGDDSAASGVLRFFGSWDLVGRGTKNTGALVWKIEHRHRYTDESPQGFGFDQGYVGLIEPPFSNQGARLTNLYWRQKLNEGRATILAGMLDVTDYVDVYALASPWTGFTNLAFSTGSAAMFLPNDATFGIAGGTMLTDRFFLIGGIANAYTDPTEAFDTVDDFFDENEYFSSIELGWTRGQDRIYLDNAHLTLWHVDKSHLAGTPGGWGAAFNYSRSLHDNKFMPFIRGGYADDGGTLLDKSLSVGLGYSAFGGRDQLGVAANWGEPNEDSLGQDLDDQYTFEVYYRLQLTEQLALTPDIQYLVDPAQNPDEDKLWIFGLRARLAL